MPEPSSEWYVKILENEFGPYTSAQLRQWAADGRINPSDRVRKGKSDWTLASSVKGLFSAESIRTQTEAAANAIKPDSVPDVPVSSNEERTPADYSWLRSLTQSQAARSKVKYQRQSDVPLDSIFDYGFRSYLSIPVIKVLWILCIILAALMVVFGPGILFFGALSNDKQTPGERFLSTYSAFVMSLLLILLTILGLVANRIAFEFLIAIFNISESLKRLEAKTD